MSAAKIISKKTLTKSRTYQKLKSEINIHKSLHHENIVEFEHFFEDDENVYLILEMCQNQTLNELVKRKKRLHELEVQNYLSQLIPAVQYLKTMNIIHRDLKLGNLFLTDKMQLKIGDFGLATKVEYKGERKRSQCGTPNFMAPEILDFQRSYSYEVDVWSIGVIIYSLLFGRQPFEASDISLTYQKIKTLDYTFPENISISNQAKNLINNIFIKDPEKRLKIEEMNKHEFFFMGKSIPLFLPIQSLVCPLTIAYINQYLPNYNESVAEGHKLLMTAPFKGVLSFVNNNKVNEKVNQEILNVENPFKHNPNNLIEENLKVSDPMKFKGLHIYVKNWVDLSFKKSGLGYIL